MIRYLLVMAMIILTPPKGNGGMPLAPKPAIDIRDLIILKEDEL